MPPTDPIKHVVLLLLENRSFDQMLGCFQEVYPNLDGIDPSAPPRVNGDGTRDYQQVPTKEQQTPVDPRHENEHVLRQLQHGNTGFVQDFADFYGAKASEDDRQLIMSFYPRMFLHGLHRMARDFTICDRWFSSVPGPTWPSFLRLFGNGFGPCRNARRHQASGSGQSHLRPKPDDAFRSPQRSGQILEVLLF